MKKIILSTLMLIGITFTTQAQEVGIRFGDVLGNDVAIDGMFSSGQYSRLHADVSFGKNAVGAELLWDFLYKPVGSSDFKWYVGVGPSALIGNDFWLGASGEVGIEYHFDGAPIAIGLDWRPTLWIVKDTEFRSGGFGLNVRYVF